MLVLKFGGTSVGDGERIAQVARIALKERETREVVVITSAMSGVTDALLDLACTAATGDVQACEDRLVAIATRHFAAADAIDQPGDWADLHRLIDGATWSASLSPSARERELGGGASPGLRATVHEIADRRDGSDMARDAIASFGERLAVILVAGAVRARGAPVGGYDMPVVATDGRFGEATPQPDRTRERAQAAIASIRAEQPDLPIVVTPGFIGRSPEGRMTTLGRGGSDYSATLLAAALDADACWIYTDVDGVFTADPRVVPEARALSAVSFAAMGRLAYCGAKVLHPRSVAPAVRHGFELRVRNTFRPDLPGTLIARSVPELHGLPQAVAGRRKLCAIDLTGRGLPEIPHLFGRMCKAIAESGAEIVLAAHPVPGHDPQVIIDTAGADGALHALEAEFARERGHGHLEGAVVRPGLALCALTGDDLSYSVADLARRSLALERIVPLAHAASPDALSFIVEEAALDRALRRLHSEAILPALRAAERHRAPSGQWVAGGRPSQRRRTIPPQH
jgi:aspartokinase/homoserine dehydrogenase 1